jgi:uncharacterized protein (DUF952 family)
VTGRELFHIAEPDDWDRAGSHYRPPSLDADGFIHLSAGDQVRATTRRHYAGRTGLVLLTIDADRLADVEIRWEAAPHGESFPHLYGALPVAAVTAVTPWPD